jgi:glycosyltransferase involved in cell wall biosynthesis
MKILMLNHEFPPVGGGASPVTQELCIELVRQGHVVDVVTMHYRGTARFETMAGVNVYRTPASRAKPNICHPYELATYLPGAFFKTLSLARKNKYDIIHCHFAVPGAPLAWLISRLTGIPFILTCHGSDVPGHNPDRFTLLHRIIKPVWRFLVKRAAAVTTPSEFLKQKILSVAPSVRVEVVPNGLDISRFPAAAKTKSILLCSRLFKFKGFQYFIEAIRDLQLDWQVNVIGDGPYLAELKKLAENSKTKINFTGWLDKNSPEYIRLFSESLIFVFPSQAENFPTVLLEAMAAGMAVITSRAGGCPEAVGDAGVYIQPDDATNIRQALLNVINNERLRMDICRQSLARVNQYAWNAVAEKYIEYYKQNKCKR